VTTRQPREVEPLRPAPRGLMTRAVIIPFGVAFSAQRLFLCPRLKWAGLAQMGGPKWAGRAPESARAKSAGIMMGLDDDSVCFQTL